MTNYEKTSKKTTKNKNYRQRDNDSIHGKIRYRLRKQLEQEGDSEVQDYVYCVYPTQEIHSTEPLSDITYKKISERQVAALKKSMSLTLKKGL